MAALWGFHYVSRIVTIAAGCLVVGPVLAQTATDPKDSDDTLEEIVVTGTSLRGEQPVGSALVTLGRVEIEDLGAPNMAEVLLKVPVFNNFNGAVRSELVGATGVASWPGMRNLKPDATLVLLNGQRMVGENPLDTSTDPSSIPPAAVQRIEIVADGASAIYGSDAVAGVVNIVLRSDLDGAETSVRKNWGEHGYEAIDLSQAFGKVWASGFAMAVIAYNENNSIQNSDLPFYKSDLTPYGGSDLRSTNCAPPNLILDGVTYTPPAYTPGTAVRCDPNLIADTIPEYRRTSVILNGRYEFNDKLGVFGHARYTNTKLENRLAPGTASPTLTTANPFFLRPTGATADSETVLMNVFSVIGQPTSTAYAETTAIYVGADYALPGDFRLQVGFDYGIGENDAHQPGFNAGALAAAAAGTTLDTALDPFEGRTNPTVAAGIADFENFFDSKQTMYHYQAKVDGTLFEMYGRGVKGAFGLSSRKYLYEARNTVGQIGEIQGLGTADAERTVNSVFAEVLVPLTDSLSVSAALRQDDYDDFGDTTNPKFGVTWSPIDSVVIRGSFGTSFHAPDMGDSYAVDTRALYFPNFPLVPPGSPPMDSLALAGGNTGLTPEEAETYSLGVDIKPGNGFSASFTYWSIDYQDVIATAPISTEVFTNPTYASFYVLNPTRAQIDEVAANFRLVGTTAPIPDVGLILDLRRANLGVVETDGIDYRVGYQWDMDSGSFSVNLSGTETFNFDLAATSTAPLVPKKNFPGSRYRAELSWLKGPISAGAAWNHSGDYEQAYSGGVQTVKAFDTLDLRASYDFGARGFLSGVVLSLNVDNVLEEEPPLLLSTNGFSQSASVLGRSTWLGIDIGW